MFERGLSAIGWVDDAQRNRVWENSAFGSSAQTYRFPIDANRPVYATGRTAAGAPTVVFHTGGTGFSSGVVVGYKDNTGCFND